MSHHHRRRDRQATDDSYESGREHRHRRREDRHRGRQRQMSTETYDEEREERRRRRRRERQATADSSERRHRDRHRRPENDGDRDRDRDRYREREGRHRHGDAEGTRDKHYPPSQKTYPSPDATQPYLTPGLEDTSYALNAYSPFDSPPAAPPAYEDRLPRHTTGKEGYLNDEVKTHASRPHELELVLGKQAPAEAELEQGENGEEEGQNDQKGIRKLERWGGPFIYVIPIFAAIGLLFAATCSADGWRVKVNVVSVDLPKDVFTRLLATGKNLGKSGPGEEAEPSRGEVAITARAAKLVAAGYVSVGFWGWCVSRPDHSEYACSPTNAWYTMEDLLETAEITSAIPARAFHEGLVHGLVMYGPAMVVAMAATVPAGIHIWRRLFRNNRNVEAGVALHASLFCGGTFSFIAFMVSKALEWRLKKKLDFPVQAGTIPAMAGIASLLLFLALAASIIPVIYRRVKRQQDILGSWDDVQAAQPTPLPETSLGRSFSLKRKKTWKRMTGYFGGSSRERRRRRRRR